MRASAERGAVDVPNELRGVRPLSKVSVGLEERAVCEKSPVATEVGGFEGCIRTELALVKSEIRRSALKNKVEKLRWKRICNSLCIIDEIDVTFDSTPLLLCRFRDRTVRLSRRLTHASAVRTYV